MKRLAILIAADEYSRFRDLNYCCADANLLSDTLRSVCGYADQDIQLMPLKPKGNCTPSKIIDRIHSLVSKSQEGDTLVFFFAGHGHSPDGKEGFLVLPDTDPDNFEQTALPLRDIANELRQPRRVNLRVFDACHSGFDVRRPQPLDSPKFLRSVLQSQPSGWVTLASCLPEQYSHEDPRLGHGVFSHSLCTTIREDFRAGEDISPEMLKLGLVKRVEEWCLANGENQTPAFHASLAGNVSLFTKLGAPAKALPAGEPTAEDDIRTRFDAVRRYARMGGEDHSRELERLIKLARETLSERAPQIQTYGSPAEVDEPLRAFRVPDDVVPKLVTATRRLKLEGLHEVRQIRSNPPPSTGPRLFSVGAFWDLQNPPQYDYSIDQPPELPESYVELRLRSDGYVPQSTLYVYLLPLQTCVCLFSGSIIQPSDSSSRVVSETRHWLLDLPVEDKKFLSALTKSVAQFESDFKSECLKRLAYLEMERRLVMKSEGNL